MSTLVKVDHLARVEGHGGITVELENGAVSRVQFDIFEGARLIESLLRGLHYSEVAPIVSRICAICSAAHTVTSLKATEAAFGLDVSGQTVLLRDLLLRGESIESHALHLFLLALPDYLGYPSALAMAAGHAGTVRLGLRLKQLGNAIQETVGGRAVHPVNAVPGGFGRLPSTDDLAELRRGLRAALGDFDAVIELLAGLPPLPSCTAPTAYAALRAPCDYGYYRGDEIVVVSDGVRKTVPVAEYQALLNEQPVAHSHARHSSFEGRPLMVGALARLVVNGDKLNGRAAAAMRRLALNVPSDNPLDNNAAQAIELLFDLERALYLIDCLLQSTPSEPATPVRARAGFGTAATEAPRGLLIHSYGYDEHGYLRTADVVTPTAINAASIEHRFRAAVAQNPGAEPAALANRLEIIARAYDPCLSCSVHLFEKRRAT